jgi:OOP family OmpA-OmpF porin
MKRSTVAAIALAGSSAALSPLAMAQAFKVGGADAGWYAGGSLGQSKIDCNTSGVAGASCDDKDTAFRAFGGYNFNQYFGAELGYADLGKVKASAGGTSAEWRTKPWDLMAVGTLPLAEKFSLYGKLGWYWADTKLSGDLLGSGSQSSNHGTYAVGAGYDFNRNLGLRAEWQRYGDVGGDNVGGKSDADMYSIGVVYRFR